VPEAKQFRIIGKYQHGCEWCSRDLFPSREEAEETLERWKREHPTPSQWTKIIEVEMPRFADI